MSKILGVDTSTIDNISGLGVGGGGISAVPVTTDTGVVLCPVNSSLGRPFSENEFSAYTNPAHMYQISDITGVQSMIQSSNLYGILKTNGDFYVGGWTNSVYMGMSSADGNSVISDGGVKLSLSGVAKVAPHSNGFFAIKTNGELWFCGSVSSYLNSTGLGGGSTTSAYGWAQVGSDSNWHDIHCWAGYPYQALAIKGDSGSRYLYATGRGTSGATGQGNTSNLLAFTRVKSASSTDLSESMEVCKVSYSSCLAVSASGKLFSWGENYYGSLGKGNTTDTNYAAQVGVATDWNNVWVNRFGGFAKKTDGTMHMTTSHSSWRIEPSTNKTFTQIGTDTDYQDLRLFDQTTSTMNYTVFAKKGGSWFVSFSAATAGGWQGSTAPSSSNQGSWVALNDALTENDITGTVDDILPFASTLSSNSPSVMFALSP